MNENNKIEMSNLFSREVSKQLDQKLKEIERKGEKPKVPMPVHQIRESINNSENPDYYSRLDERVTAQVRNKEVSLKDRPDENFLPSNSGNGVSSATSNSLDVNFSPSHRENCVNSATSKRTDDFSD